MNVQKLKRYELIAADDSSDWWVKAEGSRSYLVHLQKAFPGLNLHLNTVFKSDQYSWQVRLESPSDTAVAEIRECLLLFSKTLSIESSLDECFALGWHSKSGGRGKPVSTALGQWVRMAKSYGSDRDAAGDEQIASLIADQMAEFIRRHPLYRSCDGIVVCLASNPDKLFDLPTLLAEILEDEVNIPFLREALYKKRITAQMKHCLRLEDKLDNIRESIGVNRYIVAGKSILLVDDIYDSGLTMNATAGELRNNDTASLFGLTATKTLKRNFS